MTDTETLTNVTGAPPESEVHVIFMQDGECHVTYFAGEPDSATRVARMTVSKLPVLAALVVFLLAGVDAQSEIKATWTQLDALAVGLAVYMASLLVG